MKPFYRDWLGRHPYILRGHRLNKINYPSLSMHGPYYNANSPWIKDKIFILQCRLLYLQREYPLNKKYRTMPVTSEIIKKIREIITLQYRVLDPSLLTTSPKLTYYV